jgi:hypothetical protein
MIARLMIVVLLGVALIACGTSRTSAGEEITAGGADTAYFVGNAGEVIFWEIPKFIVWTVPKAFLWDFPTMTIVKIQGTTAEVGILVRRLEAHDLTVTEEVKFSDELRRLTGVPISSAERWTAWWERNRSVPMSQWRNVFVRDAIGHLTSDDYFVRDNAIEDLRTVYGTTLNYDPKAAEDELVAGASRWRQYLESTGVPAIREEPV